jgi:hypothetical protein
MVMTKSFAVVENSLWEGVPNYLRELNEQLEANLGYQLPVDFVPVRFTSDCAQKAPKTCRCDAAGCSGTNRLAEGRPANASSLYAAIRRPAAWAGRSPRSYRCAY